MLKRILASGFLAGMLVAAALPGAASAATNTCISTESCGGATWP